jgi:hypothetical protein
LQIFNRIQNLEKTTQNKKMLDLLNYLKLKLAISYNNIF